MDIYDYLKMDHQKVSELFKQFNKTESMQRKKEIIDFLTQELIVHAESEQATFYKALEQFNESEDDAKHGKKEHQEIEDQIKVVLKGKDPQAAWEKQVLKLKDLVDHHVKEEEGPIFRKAKKVLSNEEACAIKEKMHHYKLRFKEAKTKAA